ncbi:MAG TPA: hypothetical protein VM925_06990 [Labilithrix sp.]|nr:hypothetical protein [Labilithrix sp.]
MVLRAAFGLATILLLGCVRAVPPISAPTLIVVERVGGSALPTASDTPVSADPSWQTKDEVEVEWHGAWFPAVIIEKRGSRWLVHYEGYASDWDELVGPERVRERRASTEPEDADPASDEPDP